MSQGLTQREKNRLLTLLRQKKRDQIPPILKPLWEPCRKKMITGGRGSGKSETVQRIMIRKGSNDNFRVLWAREIMNSIDESVHASLAILIDKLKYPGWVVQEKKIYNRKTGTKFVFKGLRDIKQAQAMKSYSDFHYLIVEEAQSVPRDSWIMAVPTIRREGSEIWAIFNRYEELDAVYELYCMFPDLKMIKENGYTYQKNESTMVIECNWRDNPWFPDVLYNEMKEMEADDYDLYLHVWENHPIAQLEKAIMERALVDQAMKREVNRNGPQIFGVDVARHGEDRTIVYERRGDLVRKICERKGEAPIQTANEIVGKSDAKYVMINVDNGGLGGGGLIDRLRECGMTNVNEINFGGTPKENEKYKNVVTEMYFECRQKLLTAGIPNDKKLKQDLTGRLFSYDNQGHKIIEKKSEFKKRYKRSPDDGDACTLCFYDPGNKITLDAGHRQKIKAAVQSRRAKRIRRFLS